MNTEKVAFDIISLSGDAKAELQKALRLAREGKYDEEEHSWKKRKPSCSRHINCRQKNC